MTFLYTSSDFHGDEIPVPSANNPLLNSKYKHNKTNHNRPPSMFYEAYCTLARCIETILTEIPAVCKSYQRHVGWRSHDTPLPMCFCTSPQCVLTRNSIHLSAEILEKDRKSHHIWSYASYEADSSNARKLFKRPFHMHFNVNIIVLFTSIQ